MRVGCSAFRIPHSAFRIEEFVFMAKGVVGQLPA